MAYQSYVLAVDVGASRTAAATARLGPDGAVVTAPFALGRRSDSVATVVFVASDGELVFGDAAERRGIGQPERLVREFKRSVGDDTPVAVGGRTLPPEELYAQSLAAVVDAVSEREGARPALVSVTHPAAWGPHRLGLIERAVERHGLGEISLVTEPEAAAHHYESTRPLAAGSLLAVYDLGGGTFDAVLLRRHAGDAYAVAGAPAGIGDLGGADFDDAVFRHALAAAGVPASELSADDADARIALAQLRRECIDAKEALSFDSDVTIPVLLPSGSSSVRLTRAEFERMIEADVDRTLDCLDGVLESAAVAPEELEAILLIGGSSRIPLVAQRLSERFDRPLAVDADPKAAIALGAARLGLTALGARPAVAPAAPAPVSISTFDELLVATSAEALVPVRPASDRSATRPIPEHARRRRVPILMAAAATVVAGSLVWGGTVATASWLDTIAPAEAENEADAGTSAADDEPQADSPEPVTDDDSRAAEAAESGTEKASAEQPGAAPAPAPAEPKAKAKAKGATKKPAAATPRSTPRSSVKAPAPSTPGGGSSGSGSDSSAAAPGTGSTPPPATPVEPGPVDPTPTDPPVDPTPTDPPVDPTPTDPPVDPTPTDPPVDPTPTDPPVDPTPTDPPADPTPTDPPADPTPAPAEPVP